MKKAKQLGKALGKKGAGAMGKVMSTAMARRRKAPTLRTRAGKMVGRQLRSAGKLMKTY